MSSIELIIILVVLWIVLYIWYRLLSEDGPMTTALKGDLEDLKEYRPSFGPVEAALISDPAGGLYDPFVVRRSVRDRIDMDFTDPARVVQIPSGFDLEVLTPEPLDQLPVDFAFCGYCGKGGEVPGSCPGCGAPMPMSERQRSWLDHQWYSPRYMIKPK